MSDETNKDPGATDEATVTATEPVAAEPQEQTEPVKAFSQDEVNDILEKRLAKERRRIEKQVRDELASKPKPAEQPKTAAKKTETEGDPSSELAKLRADIEKERRDRQFSEFLADNGLKLNPTQKRMLRNEFDPNDHEAALDIVNDAGWVKANAAPAKATNGPSVPTPQATAEAKPPGYRDPGAPSGDPETSAGDPSQWDADTVARKIEQGTFRSEVEQHNRKVHGMGFNPFGQFRRRIPS